MKPPGPNSFTVSIVIIAEQHFTVKQLFNINSHCKFLIIYSELECTLYAKIKKKKKKVSLSLIFHPSSCCTIIWFSVSHKTNAHSQVAETCLF